MAKQVIMIDQPQGIGDILFIQKIVRHFADKGFKVVLPVAEKFRWVASGLWPHENVSYPVLGTDFEFSNEFTELHNKTSSEPFRSPVLWKDKFIFLPVGSSYQAMKGSMMTSKYEFLKMDWTDWADHVRIYRRPEKEKELEALVLGDGGYSFVNGQCSTGELDIFTELNAVYLREIEGYTLFDWMGVVEKAERVITIDTSLVLLCEIMKLQKPLYVVSRYKPPSFEPIYNILSLPWHFVPDAEHLVIED